MRESGGQASHRGADKRLISASPLDTVEGGIGHPTQRISDFPKWVHVWPASRNAFTKVQLNVQPAVREIYRGRAKGAVQPVDDRRGALTRPQDIARMEIAMDEGLWLVWHGPVKDHDRTLPDGAIRPPARHRQWIIQSPRPVSGQCLVRHNQAMDAFGEVLQLAEPRPWLARAHPATARHVGHEQRWPSADGAVAVDSHHARNRQIRFCEQLQDVRFSPG